MGRARSSFIEGPKSSNVPRMAPATAAGLIMFALMTRDSVSRCLFLLRVFIVYAYLSLGLRVFF